MNGRASYHDWYFTSEGGAGTDNMYSTTFKKHFDPEKAKDPEVGDKSIERYMHLASIRDNDPEEDMGYEEAPMVFYDAFDAHPIAGKSVLVMGSLTPWVEAICLHYGAKEITTSDFIPIFSEDDRIKTVLQPDLETSPKLFDAVITYSSLEHDGLGRYGDPLSPNGDLLTILRVREKFLRPGGKIYFGSTFGTLPILHWNAHRQYSLERLGLMFQGWNFIGLYGFQRREITWDVLFNVTGQTNVDVTEQPILVAQKP